jgi:hypothetical protein
MAQLKNLVGAGAICTGLFVVALGATGCGGTSSEPEAQKEAIASVRDQTEHVAGDKGDARPATAGASDTAAGKSESHRDATRITGPASKASGKAVPSSGSPAPGHHGGKGGKSSTSAKGHAGKQPGKGQKPGDLPQPASSGMPGLPPGVSVYEAARQACSDPNTLDVLPPEERRDAEFIIGFVADLAPSGQEQDARDGCRAGLQSQGIS